MPFLVYSSLRLALIFVAGVVLYAAGMRGWLLGVLAVVLALLVSYLALNKQREDAATYLAARRSDRQARGERFSKAVEEDAATEDEIVDEASAQPSADSAGDPEEVEPDLTGGACRSQASESEAEGEEHAER